MSEADTELAKLHYHLRMLVESIDQVSHSKNDVGAPGKWRERARSSKKSEATPFRFNSSQRQLLELASTVEGTTIAQIIERAVWPELEAQYGRFIDFD